jgi:hypothetical protein
MEKRFRLNPAEKCYKCGGDSAIVPHEAAFTSFCEDLEVLEAAGLPPQILIENCTKTVPTSSHSGHFRPFVSH